jgi:hypothetical protein
MARLWLSFYDVTGDQTYFRAAEKAITFVVRTQNMNSSNTNIYGAVAGSYPIYGLYERFKYPNWATKFLIDALLSFKSVESHNKLLRYVG